MVNLFWGKVSLHGEEGGEGLGGDAGMPLLVMDSRRHGEIIA
jgi:hypothetical protein